MKTTMTSWNAQANETKAIVEDAKAVSADRKQSVAMFAFATLQLLLNGKLQDKIEIGKAVAKDGPLNNLKQYVAHAKAVAVAFEPDLTFTAGTAKKPVTKTFTKDQVLNHDLEAELPFSVSTVYNKIRKTTETVTTTYTDKELAEIGTQGAVSYEELTETERAEMIQKGRDILAQAEREEKMQSIPAMAESIRAQFLELQSLDAKAAEDILNSIMNVATADAKAA